MDNAQSKRRNDWVSVSQYLPAQTHKIISTRRALRDAVVSPLCDDNQETKVKGMFRKSHSKAVAVPDRSACLSGSLVPVMTHSANTVKS